MNRIEVFRTNIGTVKEAAVMAGKLAEKLPGSRINFDLEDCDRILRVEAAFVCPDQVRGLLLESGYHCERLD